MEATKLLHSVLGACLALALAPLKICINLVRLLGPGVPSEEKLMQPAPDPGDLPWFAIKIGMAVGRFVELLPNWVNPPTIQMLQLGVLAHFKASTMKALAELGIADHLASGPKTPQELADAAGISSSGKVLFRLLRLSASSGIFDVDGPLRGPDTRFRNNRMSILLRSDHPNSIRPMLLHLGNDSDLPWLKLAEGVKVGKTPFELAWGTGIWQYFEQNPEREHVFSQAMAVQDKVSLSTALREYDWTKYDHAIDIGGAYGSFVASLMTAIPALRGTVFDMPQVVKNARKKWATEHAEMNGRVNFVGGDFFQAQTLPKPAQGRTVYVMRSILHDWDDASSIKILRALSAVMKGGNAKLVLVEQVLKDDFVNDVSMSQGFDLHMLVACGGKERTEAEWKALLGQAGFKLNNIYPSKALQAMLEAELVESASI